VAHPQDADGESLARGRLRRNLLALGGDYALFLVGLSFAARSTILPAFAAHLEAPNLVIGAIPAVMTVGWLLPSLFAAGHTVTLSRKLPFVLRYTVWERAPFLVLALAAFFLAVPAPGLTLALLLILLLVITGTGGAVIPAWMDIVGRTIPTSLRGRFFAMASLTGNAGGFLGSFATAYILATLAAPAGYGVCFVISAVFMGLSYLALTFTREPETGIAQPVVPLRTYLARVPALLRGNRNLSWFLTAQAFDVVGMMSNGFYTVYALRAHAAPAAKVGVFTTLLLSGEIAGNLVLGWLADRAGHRLVIITGAAATVAANAVGLAARSVGSFSLVFGLVGLQVAAINVSNFNILLEFAPAAAEQATYIGLGNTLLAPVTFLAPLLAGMMADTLGFESLFSVAALSGVIGLTLLVLRVRDPRHERAIRT
jgi:MFS family permease